MRLCYLGSTSDAGFFVDKRWFGWWVSQRREHRIDTAISCMNIWENTLNLYTPWFCPTASIRNAHKYGEYDGVPGDEGGTERRKDTTDLNQRRDL